MALGWLKLLYSKGTASNAPSRGTPNHSTASFCGKTRRHTVLPTVSMTSVARRARINKKPLKRMDTKHRDRKIPAKGNTHHAKQPSQIQRKWGQEKPGKQVPVHGNRDSNKRTQIQRATHKMASKQVHTSKRDAARGYELNTESHAFSTLGMYRGGSSGGGGRGIGFPSSSTCSSSSGAGGRTHTENRAPRGCVTCVCVCVCFARFAHAM